MAWFAARTGKPRPWDRTVYTAQLSTEGDPVIEREAQLLRRVALAQWIAVGGVGVTLSALALTWQVSTKLEPKQVLHVIEVNRKDAPEGEVRTAGPLVYAPYTKPDIGAQLHVLYFWLWYLRSVGDSTVLQGQAWQNVLAFSDPTLHPWIQAQIAERRKIFLAKETVQVRQVEILPVDRDAKQFRVSWIEERIALSGEVGKPQFHVAGITLVVKPPTLIEPPQQNALQKALGQKNTLGILVKSINWLALPKGGSS